MERVVYNDRKLLEKRPVERGFDIGLSGGPYSRVKIDFPSAAQNARPQHVTDHVSDVLGQGLDFPSLVRLRYGKRGWPFEFEFWRRLESP
ncbi:MAG: hypothetical protein LBJ61_10620 [Deltaproteobacteria bacterium]|nr:hypothetical protein [Deltaproteobacteria bacterium]